MKSIKKQVLEEVEKKFLGIRGWKDWEEYDRVREAQLPLEKNVRDEQLNLAIDLTLSKVCEEIENWHSEYGFGEVDRKDVEELLSKFAKRSDEE